jgi:FtsZ-binding cell division protein ZapB
MENNRLRFLNIQLSQKVEEVKTENDELLVKNSTLHSKLIDTHLLVEQNEDLKANVELLQAENDLLKAENVMLKETLAGYKSRIESLEAREAGYKSRIESLEARDEPITIREAIRILESYICLEAVCGSKTKFRSGNYNFDAIKKNVQYYISFQNVLSKYELTRDHLVVMAFLKEYGDFAAHGSSRHKLKKTEFYDLFVGDDELEASELDDNDVEKKEILDTVKIKKDLFNLLEFYNPCPTDEVWDIRDPVAKPLENPVMNLSTSTKTN